MEKMKSFRLEEFREYLRVIIHDNLATFVNDKLLKIPGDGLWLLLGLLDFPLDSSAVLFGLFTL